MALAATVHVVAPSLAPSAGQSGINRCRLAVHCRAGIDDETGDRLDALEVAEGCDVEYRGRMLARVAGQKVAL